LLLLLLNKSTDYFPPQQLLVILKRPNVLNSLAVFYKAVIF